MIQTPSLIPTLPFGGRKPAASWKDKHTVRDNVIKLSASNVARMKPQAKSGMKIQLKSWIPLCSIQATFLNLMALGVRDGAESTPNQRISIVCTRIQGFSLVELAIVLLVIGILISTLLGPLTAQINTRQNNNTQAMLEQAREALIGFAAANERLPCPAAPGATGQESPVGGGACTHPFDGFLPAATLGIAPTDTQGYALDAWGNRIRYAVTSSSFNGQNDAFTTVGGIKAATMGFISGAADTSFINICNTSAGILPNACASANNLLVKRVPAVIFSLGKNGAAATSSDEQANVNGDRVFVSKEQSNVAGQEFDDILAWVSLPILFNRMLTAGQLP